MYTQDTTTQYTQKPHIKRRGGKWVISKGNNLIDIVDSFESARLIAVFNRPTPIMDKWQNPHYIRYIDEYKYLWPIRYEIPQVTCETH